MGDRWVVVSNQLPCNPQPELKLDWIGLDVVAEEFGVVVVVLVEDMESGDTLFEPS